MQTTRYSYRILMKLDFPPRCLKSTQISNFMKIRPVGAKLFHADRQTDSQTDTTKLIVAFCNFGNPPNYIQQFSSYLIENTSTLHTPISIVLGNSQCLFTLRIIHNTDVNTLREKCVVSCSTCSIGATTGL